MDVKQIKQALKEARAYIGQKKFLEALKCCKVKLELQRWKTECVVS